MEKPSSASDLFQSKVNDTSTVSFRVRNLSVDGLPSRDGTKVMLRKSGEGGPLRQSYSKKNVGRSSSARPRSDSHQLSLRKDSESRRNELSQSCHSLESRRTVTLQQKTNQLGGDSPRGSVRKSFIRRQSGRQLSKPSSQKSLLNKSDHIPSSPRNVLNYPFDSLESRRTVTLQQNTNQLGGDSPRGSVRGSFIRRQSGRQLSKPSSQKSLLNQSDHIPSSPRNVLNYPFDSLESRRTVNLQQNTNQLGGDSPRGSVRKSFVRRQSSPGKQLTKPSSHRSLLSKSDHTDSSPGNVLNYPSTPLAKARKKRSIALTPKTKTPQECFLDSSQTGKAVKKKPVDSPVTRRLQRQNLRKASIERLLGNEMDKPAKDRPSSNDDLESSGFTYPASDESWHSR
jgi:hypothetical protein